MARVQISKYEKAIHQTSVPVKYIHKLFWKTWSILPKITQLRIPSLGYVLNFFLNYICIEKFE